MRLSKSKHYGGIYIFLVLSLLLGGSLVYAELNDSQEFVIDKVVVFPDAVDGLGWKNVETIVRQNVPEDGLYQDFNTINSAYIDRSDAVGFLRDQKARDQAAAEQALEELENEEVATSTQAASTTPGDTLSATSTPEVVMATSTPVLPMATSSLDEVVVPEVAASSSPEFEAEPEAEDEVVEDAASEEPKEPAESVATTTPISFFKRVTQEFELAFDVFYQQLPFAQLATTSSSTATINSEEETLPTATTTEETVVSEEKEEVITASTTPVSIVEELSDQESSTSSTTVSATEEVATTTIGESEDEQPVISTTTLAAEMATTTDNQSTSTSEEVVLLECTEDCGRYSLTLSGFGLPIFDEKTIFDGAQIRLSMAGKQAATRGEELPFITIRYSFGENGLLQGETAYLIDDEISNSVNGGYYLVGLPDITDPTLLDSLSIEVLYEGDPNDVEALYVDGVWVEVFTIAAEEHSPYDLMQNFESGYEDEPLSGDRLELSEEEVIRFSHTDENRGETLIIKSDETTYNGLSQAETYFSVTNTSSQSDEFSVRAHFPDGVGEVKRLEVWNQNKPKQIVLPEYRPYVYHCEAGWIETTQESSPIFENNPVFATPEMVFEDEAPTSTANSQPNDIVASGTSRTGVDDQTGATAATTSETAVASSSLETASEERELFQAAFTTNVTSSSTAKASSSALLIEESVRYVCRDSQVVRSCDVVDGDGTACRMEAVKVEEHELTSYQGGWEHAPVVAGAIDREQGLLKRASDFLGFGPDLKPVPEAFDIRAESESFFTIQPGETRYFKMDISFPAFSNGEYWIEAIGNSEYGLLDPFWSSSWDYRIPILIDNLNGTTDLTEQQVFMQLDSSLTDFWSNVDTEGADIRFVQEVQTGNIFTEDGASFDNVFDSAWSGRVAITIPASNISSTLTQFPVYVNLADLGPDFWAGVQADGRDIRVTGADGYSEVPYELVAIDTGAETGELYFRASTLSDTTDNVFHVYFNNAGAVAYADNDPFGAENVWTNNYIAVYHFEEDAVGTGTVGLYTDSTANGYDGDDENASDDNTGRFGGGLELGDNTNDHVLLPETVLDGVTDHTVSGWWNVPGSSGGVDRTILSAANIGLADEFQLYLDNDGSGEDEFHYEHGNGIEVFTLDNGAVWDTGEWEAFMVTGDEAIDEVNFYFNGVPDGENPDPQAMDTLSVDAGGMIIGQNQSGVGTFTSANRFIGRIDELRFASVVRTADWASTTYANQSTSTDFYATSSEPFNFGAVTGWYSTSWNDRQQITIGELPETLTDYPIYVDLSTLGSDFFNSVQSDGADIRVTSGDGTTELPTELVAIDTGAETGELYFKATISGGEEFYIYSNNPDATAYARGAIYGSENVWTNGYHTVYHFEEDASGTGNANLYQDSTANEYHADDETTDTDTTGRLGQGVGFGADVLDAVEPPNEMVDGLTDYTFSWWHNTTQTSDASILSAANATVNNEFLFFFPNTTTLNLYNTQNGARNGFGLADTVGSFNTGLWQFYMVTGDETANLASLYVNGEEDSESPESSVMNQLSVPNGGLVIAQEQDAVNGSYDANQRFIGQLDEMRIATVVRSAGWAEATYNNQNTPENFYSTSTQEQLTTTNFVELDFWLQHFDSTADEADIWVQVESVPAGEQTTIWLYYGASGVSSASDEFATFSYSTSTEIFHVVNDSGASSISVQSLVDNNEVSIDGGTPVALDAGESTSFSTFTGDSSVSVLGPISATVSQDGGEMLAPISFATTSFGVPTNRGQEAYYIYAPFGSTTARTFVGNSAGSSEVLNIATGTAGTATVADPSGANAVIVEASSPVLVFQRTDAGTVQDSHVAYPPTTEDLFGFDSNTVYITSLADDPDPSTFCSGGDTGSELGILRGELHTMGNCSSATQFSGDSLRLTGATEPIAAVQQADSDGNESTAFWPQYEFGTKYHMTDDAEFVAVLCSPRFGATGIEVQDSTGNTVDSGVCTPTANAPGVLRLGNPSLSTNQGLAFYPAGHQVVSTTSVPFMAIYENSTVGEDETNIGGSVQTRKFGARDLDYVFGDQELANDAEYEQISFLWYQNGNANTPTTTWQISGGEFVAEGDAITGAGALSDGDVARLRINVAARNATGTADSAAFKLQYAAATAGQCSAATNWADVGQIGSTTAAFSGFNNTDVNDGTTLATTTLTQSTVLATYEERNLSDRIPNEIGVDEVAEWDWVITASNVTVNTNYCFRMVRASGQVLATGYASYPELETVGPPNAPTNIVYFDNERANAFTPVLEFTTTDIAGDDVHYEVEIDDDVAFGTPNITRNSEDDFLFFENLNTPSDKAPFNSGARIRFNSPDTLAATSTYWWRVRASDPDGSATSSDWSVPYSFSTDGSITVSEWHQTTGDQFNTNTLSGMTVNAGNVALASDPAVMQSTGIDFDDATVGNAWGEVEWNDTETSGTSTIQVQFNDNGVWSLVPDSALPGNAIGFGTSPVSIPELDTTTYNELRLVATFEGTTVSLEDWTVRWGQRVEIPVQGDPFDNEKTADTLPVFDFFSSDPQGDDLEYEFSISTSSDFISSSTFNSNVDPGFANQTTPADTDPFNSGNTITYTAQTALTNGQTYWWRTRARDPLGGNAFSPWAAADNFTVDTAITRSTWFQTTEDQFDQGIFDGTFASTSGSVEITEEIGEYGTVSLTNSAWSTVNTTRTYQNMVVVASPEYNVSGQSDGRTPRVRNKTASSFEIKVDDHDGFTGSTDVDYIVMEAGEWVIDDGSSGLTVLAATESGVTEIMSQPYGTSNNGRTVTIDTTFGSNPVALATIASDNDTAWVSTHLDGGSSNTEWTGGNIRLALGKSLSGLSHTSGEDIDYILMDVGSGSNDGTAFEAQRVLNDVEDSFSNAGHNFTLSGFTSTPGVTVMHNNSEGGGDGSFALKDLSGTQSSANLFASVIEIGASANAHGGDETVGLVAFEDSSGIIVRNNSGTLSGTITGEDIIFSDGTGPKFGDFSFVDTTPATSDVIYQFEYAVGDGTYALLPDTEVPDNSIGTTSSPVDLTSVDINLYPTIRARATLSCGGGSCPTLDEWQLEWADGFSMSGLVREYDRVSTTTSGTVRAAVNGSLVTGSAAIAGDGTWTLNNVTAFEDDIVTVWVDGAAEADEAVTVFRYDGLGDITGVNLYEQHLSIDANELGTIGNSDFAVYDNSFSGDEDIFFDVDILGNLSVCSTGTCSDANLYIGPGQTYIASSTAVTTNSFHDLVNDGTIELDANVYNVSGSWINNATSSTDVSTVNMIASTTAETIISGESPLTFHNLSFGGGAGTSVFTVNVPLDLSGDLTVASGTLARGENDITLEGSLTTGVGGVWSGEATTTFDGAGSVTWSDANASTSVQNVGNVIIDGTSKFVTLTNNVAAYDLTIGNNDTLSGGGSYTMFIAGDWNNTGSFLANTSNVEFVPDDRTYPPPIPGSSDWYSDVNFVDRLPIVVQDDDIDGDLTNFPVYVDLSLLGPDFWDDVNADGGDIRMTTGDGQTEIAYDLVTIDTTANTGELHFLAPSLSSTATTTFYLYHNNATATAYAAADPFGRNAVWTGAGYEAVYHFAEDPTAVSNTIFDATGNGYNLVVEGAGLATSSGQLGLAVDLNAIAGRLRASSFTWTAGDPLTSSGWYRMGAADNEAVWQFGTGAQPNQLFFEPWDNGTNRGEYNFGNTAGDTYTFTPRDTANFTHFTTLGATSTSENNFVYHDGILRETQAQTVANPSNTNVNGLQVGRTGTGGEFDGEIDELRFASVLRNEDWIIAEYNNQDSPEVFYATSTVETYQGEIVIDEATHNITTGGSNFYDLTFNDATTSPAFTEVSVVADGDVTIATGTVAFPTSKFTIGGSFTNNGFFMHNNAEVEFTGSGVHTIELQGTAFLNHFYDVTFDGSGSWSFVDSSATTSNNFVIDDGTVTFPSGQLTIAGTLDVNGGGAFLNNGGTVLFSSVTDQNITTGGSAFNTIVFGDGVLGDWYDSAWGRRSEITIPPEGVSEDLTDFPVYVDLAGLGTGFWDNVATDGADVRVTSANGVSEVPRELVGFNQASSTGGLYFRASSLSSSATSTFYIYHDNPLATAYADNDPFGAENVWTNNYIAVYHFEEDAIGTGNAGLYKDSTANGYDADDENASDDSSGYLGGGLELGDDTNDHVSLPAAVLNGVTDHSISGWWKVPASSGGVDRIFLSAANAGQDDELMFWLENDGSGDDEFLYEHSDGIEAFTLDNPTTWDTNTWDYFMVTGEDAIDEVNFYLNGVADTENPDPQAIDALAIDAGGLIIGQNQSGVGTFSTGNRYIGQLDEFRFASVVRTEGWASTVYNNQSTSTAFYLTEAQVLTDRVPVFTLNEANTNAAGDVEIRAAQLVAPTDTFAIGGSALVLTGSYDPNNATTTFNSTDLGETFDFGSVSFFNLAFNGVGGGWTVSTTTVLNNFTMATGTSYVQATGTTMSVAGIFRNRFDAAATDWTNSRLILTGGDYVVTDKTAGGDDYAFLQVSGDTDIEIWNSTIATSTILDTSSIYMPDFGGADGQLNIYGDYETTGTEYWSYATDFDGTDISGSPRQANVAIASGSVVRLVGSSTLEMLGDSTASSTVSALTGAYTFVQSGSNLNASFFTVSGGDTNGWQLLDTTTITSFANGSFVVASGTTGLTADASTMNAQPSQTYSGINFASSTGSAFNVTASGTPATFWKFTGGSGDLYGEAFDNDDGDPGSIQWDDSNFTITVSGSVYQDDGVTTMRAPTCNGSTEVVTVVLDGTDTYRAPCDPFDGSYEVTGITFVGEPKITAYLESTAPTTDTTVQVYSQATTSGTVAGTTATLDMPTMIDDVVLVAIIGRDDNAGATISGPAGWTLIDTIDTGTGADWEAGMWYRVVTDAGSEPATYDFTINDTGEGFSAWVGALLNVDHSNVVDVTNVWTEYANIPDPLATDITTVTNNSLVIASWYAENSPFVAAPGGDWRTQALTSNIDNGGLLVSALEQSTAGSVGNTAAFVPSFSETAAIQVGFRASSTPTIEGSATAAVVTQTPLGGSSPYETIRLRDQRADDDTVVALSDVTIPLPAVADGDLAVAVIARDDNFGFTGPAGWTLADEFITTSGADKVLSVWYRQIVSAGAEPASYNFTSLDATDETYSYWIGTFSGVDETNPFDVVPSIVRLLDDQTPAAESITTVTPGAHVLAIWATENEDSATLPGGSWTTLVEDIWGGNVGLNIAEQTFATAGATGDVELTSVDAATDDSLTLQLALRPAAVSVPTTITDFDLYQDRVIVRHEDLAPLSIADMTRFDSTDDSDVPFTAATNTAPHNLSVAAGSGLYVWNDKTFVPNGDVLLSGAGTAPADGSLRIGNSATYTSSSTHDLTIGGSFFAEAGATYIPASTTVTFTATSATQLIASAASSTFTFYDIDFTGAGGEWAVQTPIVSLTDISVATGTVRGGGDITVETGSFSGNGLVTMESGATLIKRANTLGGTQGWTFSSLTLGDSINSEITTPGSAATTTILDTLTIATGHFLDAGSAIYDLRGSGTVFVENGTFFEDTSTVRYSGGTPSVLRTTYHNLVIDADASTVVATAPVTGLQILGDLKVGRISTSTLNLNSNDPFTAVGGDVFIGALGTIEASDSNTLEVFGNWDNDGVFVANGGTTTFSGTVSETVSAGSSSFANLYVSNSGTVVFDEHATATGYAVINAGNFVMGTGTSLAIGGTFTNQFGGGATNWNDAPLFLYSGNAYEINTKGNGDAYFALKVASGTQPRVWDSYATTTTVRPGSSLYSMDHSEVDGSLYIYGDYHNRSYDDYWSYATDFDGAALNASTSRAVSVEVEVGGSVFYQNSGLAVVGVNGASTTVNTQTAGTFDFIVGGTSTVEMSRYVLRDLTSDGLVFSGSPDVTDLSFGDFEVAIGGGSGMTVGGTVISNNPAQNYTRVKFATTTAIAAFNVTATGTAASSWRFVNVPGNLAGEQFDNDPGGDPGLVVWEDSAAIINISGNVYENDGVTVSSVCDGSTLNIALSMDGLSFASTSCAAGTGAYSFVGISYGLSDVVTVYIDTNGGDVGAAVSQDPISSIGDMDLYEDHVIARHESGAELTIADMATWDSSDDADIPFTALTGTPDTLVLPADTKLLVWTNKTFAPGGDVTVSGGGGGAAHDGTVELLSGATYQQAAGETTSIGGSLLSGVGATYDASTATTTFTTSGAARTIDSNDGSFHHLDFTGSGSWNVADAELNASGNVFIRNGALTLPAGTTTLSGSFITSGGSFDANGGLLVFDATTVNNQIAFAGSDAAEVFFNGDGGSWSFNDANATTTRSFTVATGSVTLPGGVLHIDRNFIVEDTIAHNSGTVVLASTTGSSTLALSGNDLFSLSIVGGGDYTLSDLSAALLGDLTIAAGGLRIGDNNFSIAGSLDATGGVFATGVSTVLFNSDDTGETIDPGANEFYNVIFTNALGGWTLSDSATTTNNLIITDASSFVAGSGNRIYVGGVFQNSVGGAATTWTGSTLVLDSGSEYQTNAKTVPAEFYETLILGENTDISMWNASATTPIVPNTSSLYSQDHAGVDGLLYVYGDYNVATTSEFWSYATDFDGVPLGGSSRAVTVRLASGATTTVSGGSLEIVGAAGGATTTVENQGSGTYALAISGGTLNAQFYSLSDMNSTGLTFSGTPAITSLSNGDFTQGANNDVLITLASTTLDANASLQINRARFTDGGFTGGVNVSLDATTTNSWTFADHTGNLSGEDYDIDGTDQCSSIRWDDSLCLLTEQAHYRWRNDDGGEGAAPGTWFDDNWGARKRVRVINNDPNLYTNAVVQATVVYDADMQSDFDDLRFTDSTGITEIPYWIERFTPSVTADVWVQVPSMAADSVTELYMYFDNGTATTTSSSSAVFIAVDDFEDDDIAEYSGEFADFQTDSTFAYGGGFGLEPVDPTDFSDGGMADFNQTVSQGEIIRYRQYIDTAAGTSDEACVLFGVQAPVSAHQNYGVCLELFGTDRLALVENAVRNDSQPSVSVLSSAAADYSTAGTGWYEVEIDWQSGGLMDVSLFDPAGTLLATTSATDTTNSSGGFGFTFWTFNGGWDSFTSRPRVDTEPTVRFGAKQADGGASWAAAQNTAVGGFALGETARLRVGIENSGLDIENQQFQLEYAAKLTAPSCEAVSPGDFTVVPVVASCGSSPICMTTSASTTDGDLTTDHLVTDAGTFIAGEIVTDPSNQTSNIDVAQNEYTELEYAINLTVNATNDSYCFRVTDNGSTLDSYAIVPELTLAFDPVLSAVTLNNGADIDLTPGTTTRVFATGTVTDFNGVADLATASATIYRSGAGAACAADLNNCYISSSTTTCSFINCAGTSCTLSCYADIAYHADPTDIGTFAGEEWLAYLEVEDLAGGFDLESAPGVELNTLRALDVDDAINYGTVDVSQDTGAINTLTRLYNLGNESIDVDIAGTDMTDGAASVIPAAQQLFATSTFDYSTCTDCRNLTATGTDFEVDLDKPTTTTPYLDDEVYWGIAIPFGTASAAHQGSNTFTAIGN